MFFSMEIQTLKGPMEQWDPGIATSFHFCTEDCNVELAHSKLIQAVFQQYIRTYALLHGHAHIHLRIAMLFRFGCPAGGDIFTYSTYYPPDVTSLLTSAVSNVQTLAWNIVQYFFIQQASTGSRFIEYSKLIGCELLHWKITWPLYLLCSTSGNNSGRRLHPTNVRCQGYLVKRKTALEPVFTRTVQVVLLVIWSRAHHTGTCRHHYLTSGMAITLPFQFFACVAIWSFHSLEFCQGGLSWDPGIWALLYFFGTFAQAKAIERMTVSAPAYISHDYNLGVFPEQVCIIYLTLVKVCFDYSGRCDLGEVMTHQVPWDPGGSTWSRLEGKPDFKDGGMLATPFPIIAMAGPWAVSLLGLGFEESLEACSHIYEWISNGCGGLDQDGFGLHRFCLLFPRLRSSSSFSSAPLLPVMAGNI
jgi:hypothetical protein